MDKFSNSHLIMVHVQKEIYRIMQNNPHLHTNNVRRYGPTNSDGVTCERYDTEDAKLVIAVSQDVCQILETYTEEINLCRDTHSKTYHKELLGFPLIVVKNRNDYIQVLAEY